MPLPKPSSEPRRLVVVDCDALNFMDHLGVLDLVELLVGDKGWRLLTIRSVYQRELQDHLRARVEAMQQRWRFQVDSDPDRCDLTSSQLKLRKRVERNAKKLPVSTNDRQLLFLAMDLDTCLISMDKPLGKLASKMGFEDKLDLLDVVDALKQADILDAAKWEELLGSAITAAGGRPTSVVAWTSGTWIGTTAIIQAVAAIARISPWAPTGSSVVAIG